ncbi:hypothetical protein JOC70_000689 [Clostridium pascui]|uniref:hypothetical protein n=1 Tax=Clostridium pascui TaxID=46609 RepID=UPI001956BF7F|nr:hypothetical protein [Clostridium pascui]MBM7869220.1 hypothetical protein [Clostridium pascui]
MKNNSKNIDNLCQKIDRLIDSTEDSVKVLYTTATQWNIEQKNNIQHIEQISKNTAQTDSKIDVLQGKIDALLSIKSSREEDK